MATVPYPGLHTLLATLGPTRVHEKSANEAAALQREAIRAGYKIIQVVLTNGDTRTAQAIIATALRLPETACTNLDAMADSLRDLSYWWPKNPKILLLIKHCGHQKTNDPTGWATLLDVLNEASAQLWHGTNDPADRLFETVITKVNEK